MKPLALIGFVLGILLVIVAILYFALPASSLPHFIPGYEAGVAKHHIKHGIGALLLGLGAFALTWFQSGKKSAL